MLPGLLALLQALVTVVLGLEKLHSTGSSGVPMSQLYFSTELCC